MKIAGVAGERIKSTIERVERIHEQRDELANDVRDIFQEAKSAGLNVKALRRVLQLRRMEDPEREAYETDVDLYMRAMEETGTVVAINSSHAGARTVAAE